MSHNIIGALVTAVIGMLIAFVNFSFSKKVLEKAPDKYALITVARQVLQIGFLAIVYFVGIKIQVADTMYLLVGAVLGMTLPMFYFTKKLLTINEAFVKTKKEDDANG
ncbi:MAG: hypothetical protein IKV25_04295 [Clostridia bacterium]|nr:hypothetical protein [Clostridia bacterium]